MICLFFISIILLSLSGCTAHKKHVRVLKIPRVDQDMSSGNQGYIQGRVPPRQCKVKDQYLEVIEIDMSAY